MVLSSIIFLVPISNNGKCDVVYAGGEHITVEASCEMVADAINKAGGTK